MTNDKIKVIGTGLTGLVGSRVKELTEDVFDWTNLSRSSGVDITDEKSVTDAIEKSDSSVLVHFAAFTDLKAANKERGNKKGLCYRINVLGTRNMVQACQKYGKYLIHVSTDAVFGGGKKSRYTEEDLPNPIEWYGQTKAWAEEEVLNSGCQSVIMRFAYPFRARFEPKKDFVRKIIGQLSGGEKISMFEDTIFTPTFIDDIAPALAAILIKKPEGIFHVVGSTALSPIEAAKEVAGVFDLDKRLIEPQKLGDYLKSGGRPYPRYAGLSNEKLKRKLGIPMRAFSEALWEMKKHLAS